MIISLSTEYSLDDHPTSESPRDCVDSLSNHRQVYTSESEGFLLKSHISNYSISGSVMSRKRLREHPTVDTHLVEIYEDLANVDEKIRLKAAHSLLTGFICQENASLEQLNEILRRLIRGLCSSRKAARLGFSVALTELLVELFGHNNKHAQGFQAITELLETLKIQTHVSGNVSGQVSSSAIPFGYYRV